MENKNLSNPFIILMDSGATGRHCDRFPHLSVQEAKKDDEGNLFCNKRKNYPINPNFTFKELVERPETKHCPDCINDFILSAPFLTINDQDVCIRCYERKYLPNREEYKKLVRQELYDELEKALALETDTLHKKLNDSFKK